MTNREYISKLSNRDFIEWVLYEAPEIGRMSTLSIVFLTEWLDKEYEGWINLREYSKILMERLTNDKSV